jgi:hypothetical protein
MAYSKRIFVAALWFGAMTVWGSIVHVFTGLPDLGVIAGLVAVLWIAGAPKLVSANRRPIVSKSLAHQPSPR